MCQEDRPFQGCLQRYIKLLNRMTDGLTIAFDTQPGYQLSLGKSGPLGEPRIICTFHARMRRTSPAGDLIVTREETVKSSHCLNY